MTSSTFAPSFQNPGCAPVYEYIKYAYKHNMFVAELLWILTKNRSVSIDHDWIMLLDPANTIATSTSVFITWTTVQVNCCAFAETLLIMSGLQTCLQVAYSRVESSRVSIRWKLESESSLESPVKISSQVASQVNNCQVKSSQCRCSRCVGTAIY